MLTPASRSNDDAATGDKATPTWVSRLGYDRLHFPADDTSQSQHPLLYALGYNSGHRWDEVHDADDEQWQRLLEEALADLSAGRMGLAASICAEMIPSCDTPLLGAPNPGLEAAVIHMLAWCRAGVLIDFRLPALQAGLRRIGILTFQSRCLDQPLHKHVQDALTSELLKVSYWSVPDLLFFAQPDLALAGVLVRELAQAGELVGALHGMGVNGVAWTAVELRALAEHDVFAPQFPR